MKPKYFHPTEKGCTGFWIDEYSGGWRLSKKDGNLTVSIAQVCTIIEEYLTFVGREVPPKDTLLITGQGYYELNFKLRTATFLEYSDTGRQRANWSGLVPGPV